MEKARLSDIANLAGVSKAAAGKVLNGGRAQIRVGVEARKRILEAAQQLNYQPNMAASILAGGSSKLIGVLLDPGTSYRYLRLLREIERICAEKDYRIITSFTHDNIVNMEENYRTLLRYGVSGFICCAHDYPDLKEEAKAFFSGENNIVYMEKPICEGKPYVRTSRLKALAAMIRDARSAGCSRIGLLSASTVWQTEATLHQEFVQAMHRNGLEADPKLILQYPGKLHLSDQADAVMKNMIQPYRPDFLYIDDAVHAGVIQTRLLQAGLKIPIHGGNNDPLFEGLGLRSFDPCYGKIAEALLELLLNPGKRGETPVIESIYQ